MRGPREVPGHDERRIRQSPAATAPVHQSEYSSDRLLER
jgi:hypothetical protein